MQSLNSVQGAIKMEQIGALDANFLYTETKSVNNHIASIQILQLPEGQSNAEFITGLKSVITNRRHLVPYLTRKLKFVPANIDHPFWIEDQNFNIDNHIFEVALEVALEPKSESGDGFERLQKKVAEIHAVPMNRAIPLWSIQVITGFAEGKVAYYNQVHHSCVDGVSAQLAITQLMDPSSEIRSFEQPVREQSEVEEQSANNSISMFELFSRSAENLFSYQADNHSRLLGQMESAAKLSQRAVDPSKQLGALFDAAPTIRFNKSIASDRTYTAGQMSLSEIKQIGKALDCKVNDVFMSVVAGGLRTYLERKGELPDRGLIAGCPVSLRAPGDESLCNQVTMMKVDLATNLADPSLRLLAIRDSALTAKEVTADLSHGLTTNVSVAGLPATLIAAAQWAELTRSADNTPPAVNIVISNVPGPRETLYSNGAQVLTHYPVSIPVHGVGVNITVQSYIDELYFAITACAKALPDSAQLRTDIYAAFEALKARLLPEKATVLNISKLQRHINLDADASIGETVSNVLRHNMKATKIEKVA
jgi:diacylglycerol O-acyltransferase